MKKQERKRFDKLQSEAYKEAGNSSLKTLTFPDLLLLLRHDEALRALIRDVVNEQEDEPDDSQEHGDTPSDPQDGDESSTKESKEIVSPTAPAMPIGLSMPASPPPVPLAPPPDSLRGQLDAELTLLQAVRADAELADEWLGFSHENEGKQLVRLIVRFSQWDTVIDLWDTLAKRCKQEKRAASATEQQILAQALRLHNLRWNDRQASLCHAIAGAAYDYRYHQRSTTTGDIIQAEWLPGLINAGGEPQKPPLVQT